MTRFFQVVDDFYSDPNFVRKRALELEFSEPSDFTGWRTNAYQPNGIKQLIEKKLRVHIRYWEKEVTAVEACNGVFMSAFSRGRRAETVGIHYDEPVSWMMLLVYLTPKAPPEAGTSFWEHRQTGLVQAPTQKDADRLGLSIKKLRTILENDSGLLSRWREIDRVSNRYNRAVMFPSGLLHSASKHFGGSLANGRLYQSFHFPMRSQ